MQIRLFEDSKEIQLRFKETDQPHAALPVSQGKTILYFHTHVKFILTIPGSISKIFVSIESKNIIVKHPFIKSHMLLCKALWPLQNSFFSD